MKTFIATLKHDNGLLILKTTARDIGDAIFKICLAENCPIRAIIKIKEIKK